MVTILTDSASDIMAEEQKKYNIKVAPMPINFGNECYLSGETLSNEEFYAKLKKADPLPTTSMVNSMTFQEFFEKEIKNGNEVVVITISSKLSVTYEQAVMAAKEVNNKKIFVIDSLNAALGEGALVIEATKLRDAGKSAQEIFNEINKLISKVRVIAVVDTLKYLKAGGRLSSTAAFVGTILNVKPIIAIEDGKVVSKSKAIGKMNAYKSVASMVKKLNIDRTKTIIFAHAHDKAILTEFSQVVEKESKIVPTEKLEIGSTIGVHAGPGTVGVALFEK